MLKKILDIFKNSVIMWVWVLLPTFLGLQYIKSSSRNDICKYVDAYVDSEATCLSKYIGLQHWNTCKDIRHIANKVMGADPKKDLSKTLTSFKKSNDNILSISMHSPKGEVLSITEGDTPETLSFDRDEVTKLKIGEVFYSFKQLDDGTVVSEYLTPIQTVKKKRAYLAIDMKWAQYENFLDRLQDGTFARKFYVISPICKRYLSLNSLPNGAESNRNLVALGLHLADKIDTIQAGASDIKLEKYTYRAFKDQITLPNIMSGPQLFIVAITDDDAVQSLSKGMLSSLHNTFIALLIILLAVTVSLAVILHKSKVAQVISETVTASNPSAVVVFDAETGKIRNINGSGRTLMRLADENIENVNTWDIFLTEQDRLYLQNAVKTGLNLFNWEVFIQTFSGNTFWSICSANSLMLESDQKVYIVLSILDINRRKEIEKKLANNAELLEKQIAERTADLEAKAKELEDSSKKLAEAKANADTANEAKTKFLANVSTELKTPVNAIIGYSDILKEEALDRKDNVSADDLDKIIGSAKHLLSLIDGILDLSTIEAGKTRLFLENINVKDILKEVEGVALPLITKNENTLMIECSREIDTMYIDQTKLRQCLLNLIDNAAKFTEFGKITIRVSHIVHDGLDFVEFSVLDTGVGIPADKLDKIFMNFQDSDEMNTETGLGLSITKKYVEYMGGSVSAESDFGIGSKFIIRLPKICTVKSAGNVEVKNHEDDQLLNDFVDEAERDIEEAEDFDFFDEDVNDDFSRMSDET